VTAAAAAVATQTFVTRMNMHASSDGVQEIHVRNVGNHDCNEAALEVSAHLPPRFGPGIQLGRINFVVAGVIVIFIYLYCVDVFLIVSLTVRLH
jgi:hypothetical protein